VYAVLPFSIAFLITFNYLSGFMSRARLFNTIILAFTAFLLLFAFALYPHHNALHPHAAADVWLTQARAGREGCDVV